MSGEGVSLELSEDYRDIREAVGKICDEYPGEYWRGLEDQGPEGSYPTAFVKALTDAGFLGALIPEEYGGSGLGLTEASIIMEEVNRCGGNAGHCHGQMYNMGTLLRHGSEEQKQKFLPGIASGALRLQSMAVTEPIFTPAMRTSVPMETPSTDVKDATKG